MTEPPPITQIVGRESASGGPSVSVTCPVVATVSSAIRSASARSRARTAPSSAKESSRVMTMFVRPGSGRNVGGNDCQVRRPITTGEPFVVREKCLRSSLRCQGMVPSAPITPSRACAQIRPIRGECSVLAPPPAGNGAALTPPPVP